MTRKMKLFLILWYLALIWMSFDVMYVLHIVTQSAMTKFASLGSHIESHGASLTAPKWVVPGSTAHAWLQIDEDLGASTGNINVRVLQGKTSILESSQISRVSRQLYDISLWITADMKCGKELSIEVTVLSITLQSWCTCRAITHTLLLDIDKAVYKPGQTVLIRVLAVTSQGLPKPGLPVALSITQTDPDAIIVFKETSTLDEFGSAKFRMPLPHRVSLGKYGVLADADGVKAEGFFTVEDYVLPRFGVTLDVDPAIVRHNELRGQVTAQYVYGKAVAGYVKLRFKHGSQILGTLESPISGVWSFNFTHDHLFKRWMRTIQIEASVREDGTETEYTATRDTAIVEPYNVKILPLHEYFSPNLPIDLHFSCTDHRGVPVVLTFSLTVSFYFSDRDTTPHSAAMTVVCNGTAGSTRLQVPTTGHESSYCCDPAVWGALSNTCCVMYATLKWQYASEGSHSPLYLARAYSPSRSHLQLYSAIRSYQVGAIASFEVMMIDTSVDMGDVYVVVSSDGQIFETQSLQSPVFDIMMEESYVPQVDVTVYYVRFDGEVVADSLHLQVFPSPSNVALHFSQSEAQPADHVNLTVTAMPNSKVFLLITDHSTQLLGQATRITAGDLLRAPTNPNHIKPWCSCWLASDALATSGLTLQTTVVKSKVSCPVPWSKPRPSPSMLLPLLKWLLRVWFQTFRTIWALVTPSNWNVDDYDEFGPVALAVHYAPSAYRSGDHELSIDALADHAGHVELSEVTHVRSFFPETWLWQEVLLDDDSTAVLPTIVPDTITTWDAMVFAQHPTYGLHFGTVTSLQAFKPFFVEATLPSSAIRGETLEFPCKVFNYSPQSVFVVIKLQVTKGLGTRGSTVWRGNVPSNSSQTVYFIVQCLTVGLHRMTLVGQTPAEVGLADATELTLQVHPEGVTKFISSSDLLDVNASHLGHKTFHISLPANVVPDSVSLMVSVTGDVMGPSLSSLDQLLQLPTGCGEQTIIDMAPNVYALNYMQQAGTLTADFAERAKSNIRAGYMRELTYRHPDGSFSAFGTSDSGGSLWLTAFVLKVFAQSSAFVTIDENVMRAAVTYLKQHQTRDGAFPPIGRVVHEDMMGGVAGGEGLTALTAFVTISLLEWRSSRTAQVTMVDDTIRHAIKFLTKPNASTSSTVASYTIALKAVCLQLAAGQSLISSDVANAALASLRRLFQEGPDTAHHYVKARADSATHSVSADIEATAYALLAVLYSGQRKGASGLMKWLVRERNGGGFYSTQDTVMGLQALALHASLFVSNTPSLTLQISSSQKSTTHLNITAANWNVLQTQEVSPTGDVTVNAMGTGKVLVSALLQYNVPRLTFRKAFEIQSTCLVEGVSGHGRCRTCMELSFSFITSQVIAELGMFSGYVLLDPQQLITHNRIKAVELGDRLVHVYLEYMKFSEKVCLVYDIVTSIRIDNAQPVPAVVYDYYSPHRRGTVTVLYTMGNMRKIGPPGVILSSNQRMHLQH